MSTFDLKSWQICGHIAGPKTDIFLQKIAIFLRKWLKIEEIQGFWAKSWDICGRYALWLG